jgi:hypothetical protein
LERRGDERRLSTDSLAIMHVKKLLLSPSTDVVCTATVSLRQHKLPPTQAQHLRSNSCSSWTVAPEEAGYIEQTLCRGT